MKLALKGWQKQRGCVDPFNIEQTEMELQSLEEEMSLGNNGDGIKLNIVQKRSMLWSLYQAEEQRWQQKSRSKWIVEGDRNTSFFHGMANMRRRRNSINQLVVGNSLLSNPTTLKDYIAEQFELHFKQDVAIPLKDLDCSFFTLLLASVNFLESPFLIEEIWEVIQRCDGDMAPGSDGFNMNFIKMHWGLFK
ncbi:hypothetical protein PTKIN_Ptkin02bG0190400 [Pterospermum kingtungense]